MDLKSIILEAEMLQRYIDNKKEDPNAAYAIAGWVELWIYKLRMVDKREGGF